MNVAMKQFITFLVLASRSTAEMIFPEFSTRTPSPNDPTTTSPSNMTSPPAPNGTVDPQQQCSGNSNEWEYALKAKVDGGWWVQRIGCDDYRVTCEDEGNMGLANDHCCKCKVECMGQCSDPVNTLASSKNTFFLPGHHPTNEGGDSTDFGEIYRVLAPILILVCCIAGALKDFANQRDLRATRQTMVQRRQQQREASDQVAMSEEESKNARHDLFMTKFHFQMVLPDKSNTTADRVRNTQTKKQDEECPKGQEETELELDDDSTTSTPPTSVENDHPGDNDRPGETRFPERLFSLRMPEAKDECCVCLDCYSKGETICAPITTNCNHVFHKDCIYEWLKTKDRCPLCRVDLLKD